MKTFLKTLKYIAFTFLLVFGFGTQVNHVDAAFVYTAGEIPYQVVAGNQPPIVEAGPNQIITGTSWTILAGQAYAHDPDGDSTIVSTIWTQTGGPSATITNGTGFTPTFSGINAINTVYTFTLTATDDHGLTASDFMTVMVNPVVGDPCLLDPNAPGCPGGPGSPVNGQCNLAFNNSCTAGVYADDGHQVGSNWVWTCGGVNGGTDATCTKANTTVINGSCGSTANTCTAGSVNPNPHSGTDPFTWTCTGANGGTNASCTAPYSVTECSDGLDNDGDGFVDWNGGMINGVPVPKDPGCKDALDDSEKNVKINVIEI